MSNLSDSFGEKLIDCHVHLAALPDGNNGCYISPRMLKSPLFTFLLWRHKLHAAQPTQANQKYLDDLLTELRASTFVGKAVLLGMDGVFDTAGRLDRAATDFLISNDYVLTVVQRYPHDFLAGVSINPQRADAVDELSRCVESGASLVKVLPNSQQFDPSNPRYKNFYRAMADYRIPLLSHVGYEFSLIGKDQSVGDPGRLRVPLDEGVTVIAAHACSYGLMLYEKFLPVLFDFVRRYRNFFADISALTLPNRFKMLLHLRKHPEIHPRLLFGTDYPLSVFHVPAWGRIPWRDLSSLIKTSNRFDRHYLVCKKLGLQFGSVADLPNVRKI